MNTKLAEVKATKEVEEAKKSTLVPEILSYLGALLFISGVTLILYQQWDDISQAQKTATFSLLAIAFFTSGLLAGDTVDIRRRVSSFLYVLSASGAGLAVYVTFPEDLAPFRALALVGFALGTWSFFLASQGAFAYDYHSLSYTIALGLIATCMWMYTKVRSWVLVTSAILAFVVSLSEFILETLDGSLLAATGLLAIGAITILIGIRSIGNRRN
ncbi:MAG: DUF2157 domain-containing protein [Actinobacteria bacterium]|nr:DUF2157 domain-containing protein [Actinomycetota bacterium]